MNFHDPIIDRNTMTFVMFGEGDYLNCQIHDRHPNLNCRPGPPFWMVDAAKPCDQCIGHGYMVDPDGNSHHCDLCDDGRQRHTITVPCDEPGCPHVGPCNRGKDGRGYIAVPELAVVEWGPLEVIGQTDEPSPIQGAFDRSFITLRHHNGKPFLVRFTQGQLGEGEVLTLPPDIDPQSLVGQYAIGGKLVTP